MGLIDCKAIREEILNEVKSQLAELKGTPRLCIVTIGNDDASKVYVRNKIKTAKEVLQYSQGLYPGFARAYGYNELL